MQATVLVRPLRAAALAVNRLDGGLAQFAAIVQEKVAPGGGKYASRSFRIMM